MTTRINTHEEEDKKKEEYLLARMVTLFKLFRKITNKNQDQIAEEMGISQQALSYIENGNSMPSMPTIMRLCRAYKTSPSFFFLFLLSDEELDIELLAPYVGVFAPEASL